MTVSVYIIEYTVLTSPSASDVQKSPSSDEGGAGSPPVPELFDGLSPPESPAPVDIVGASLDVVEGEGEGGEGG